MKQTLADLQKLSDDEFYNNPPMPGDCYEKSILYPIEVSRRQRLHQHELNLEVLRRQKEANVKFLKITISGTIVAAILGAVVGGVVQFVLPGIFAKQGRQEFQQAMQVQAKEQASEPHSLQEGNRTHSPKAPKEEANRKQ